MGPLLQGILLGMTFAVLLGPAFFALIQTSIHRGFRYGAFMATGIFLSDVLALTVCYFGASQILGEDPRQNIYFSMVGGIILIIFGTFTFTRKGSSKTKDDEDSKNNSPAAFYVYIIKGFFLNALNPGMWFIWITIVVSVGAKYGVNSHSIFLFLIGVLSTIFGTDLLKCFISNQIKKFINDQLMTWMNRVVGLALIGFGTYLILRVFIDMEQLMYYYQEILKKIKPGT